MVQLVVRKESVAEFGRIGLPCQPGKPDIPFIEDSVCLTPAVHVIYESDENLYVVISYDKPVKHNHEIERGEDGTELTLASETVGADRVLKLDKKAISGSIVFGTDEDDEPMVGW